MHNVIRWLVVLGWKPISYNSWRDNCGTLWTLTYRLFLVHRIVKKIVDSFNLIRL